MGGGGVVQEEGARPRVQVGISGVSQRLRGGPFGGQGALQGALRPRSLQGRLDLRDVLEQGRKAVHLGP